LVSKPALDEVIRQGIAWTRVYQENEMRALEEAADRGGRRGRPTPVLLRLVAQIVAANPQRPSTAVAERLHVSHRTGTRYVTLARQQGYLNEEGK
jgi:hypothetical protein